MSEELFKAGSVYRDVEGDLIRLISVSAEFWDGESKCWSYHGGLFNLKTGECARFPNCNLIPGELHLRDGQWVPVEEGDDFDDGGPYNGLADAYPIAGSAPMPHSDSYPPAPLVWDKPTPFDAFPDFHVRSFNGEERATSHGPLQQLADSTDPLHGSAVLKAGAGHLLGSGVR